MRLYEQHWCFDGNDGVKDNDQNRTRRLIWSFQASDNPKMIMMKFMMMLMIILSFQASYSQKCKKARQGEVFGQVFHQIIKENLQTPSWGNFPKSRKKNPRKKYFCKWLSIGSGRGGRGKGSSSSSSCSSSSSSTPWSGRGGRGKGARRGWRQTPGQSWFEFWGFESWRGLHSGAVMVLVLILISVIVWVMA